MLMGFFFFFLLYVYFFIYIFLTSLLFRQLTETMDINRVLLYLIKRMEPMRCLPFVLIYGCHTLGEAYYPDTNFMQCVFDLFSYRFDSKRI